MSLGHRFAASMCNRRGADATADSGENAKLLRQLHKKFIERLT